MTCLIAQSTAGLTVLTAMITPAVLILATGSLLMTTSQRLNRSVDRARKLSAEIAEVALDPTLAERREVLFGQLLAATLRSRLLQRGMTCLYIAQGFFVATSMVLGLLEFSQISIAWAPGSLGIAGTLLLLAASGFLIRETRVALGAVEKEMTMLTGTCREAEARLRNPEKE